ncbi:nucleotidyl transferase AbiEii/AbiGii toxin family protein [Rhodococcus qingshengii]|uniref:Nucleotidyl transferase AbiEii/AbiGii toxin family protein n=1 Tax=Rhodococcus qingshengii TaxID=334542 RepID=A0A2A5J1L4_RHOSG|nr:nucleotidyl transferase AbiEii/AbiGii toxin family protein [Rhodococcus qingshengii]PCK23252.1 hypothetical protein CHR55_30340 [Rhodococcus qingshengii]
MTIPRLRENLDELEALTQAAAEFYSLRTDFVEKDFWAIEVLRVASRPRLIVLKDGATATVEFAFKGGTSLSRVFNLVERFSEDIDLLVIFPENGSTKARDRILKDVHEGVRNHLGLKETEAVASNQKVGVKRSITYEYPTASAPNSALREGVLLEMGSRGGDDPTSRRFLRSMVAEFAITELNEDPTTWEEFTAFELRVLAPERTLLEKLSAVHTAATDGAVGSGKLAQHGRHYYDIHKLLESADVRASLAAMGPDRLEQLADDIHQRGLEAGWDSHPRPSAGYATSVAFSDEGEIGETVRAAYAMVAELVYGVPVTLDECFETVRRSADLI